jgi:hypothetical protein
LLKPGSLSSPSQVEAASPWRMRIIFFLCINV